MMQFFRRYMFGLQVMAGVVGEREDGQNFAIRHSMQRLIQLQVRLVSILSTFGVISCSYEVSSDIISQCSELMLLVVKPKEE